MLSLDRRICCKVREFQGLDNGRISAVSDGTLAEKLSGKIPSPVDFSGCKSKTKGNHCKASSKNWKIEIRKIENSKNWEKFVKMEKIENSKS